MWQVFCQSSSLCGRNENSDKVCSCRDADKVSRRVADVLRDVAGLEILQAPGLSFIVPDMFASQPRLTGEAPDHT